MLFRSRATAPSTITAEGYMVATLALHSDSFPPPLTLSTSFVLIFFHFLPYFKLKLGKKQKKYILFFFFPNFKF